jgi:membrane protease YdiL (CAAX protease family)
MSRFQTGQSMSGKSISRVVSTIVYLTVLTFVIPIAQWVSSKFIPRAEYGGITSSIVIILCVGLLLWKTKRTLFLSLSSRWKLFCYLAVAAILILLTINILNRPVARITGQPRSSFEVLDVIILLPIAEELIFRGAIWSRIQNWGFGQIAILAGTSLLFGIEHLGYWAQTSWSLPPGAYFHAFSMIFAGAFFGFFRLKSGSLTIPTALHMLANGAILLTQ